MARLWRVLVLVLAVMPLAMPAVCWSRSSQCKAQMAAMEMDHHCCPEHATVVAPSCCNAKADLAFADGRYAADETASAGGPQALVAAPLLADLAAHTLSRPNAAYIPIQLPALILRT